MPNANPEIRVVPLEGGIAEVVARFLPQNLVVDKIVPWTPQKKASPGDVSHLQFVTSPGRLVALELLFDQATTGVSVQPELDRLMRMAQIVTALKRPPRIALRWPGNALPEVRGVIEVLAIRYAVFSAAGLPIRATAMIRVREAGDLKVGKP